MSPIIRTFGEEMAMDLLTRLSPWPANISLVVERDDMHAMIRLLKKLNFKIIVAAHKGCRCVWIADIGWRAADAAASGYLERVERH